MDAVTAARIAARALLQASALGGAGAVPRSAFLGRDAVRRARMPVGPLARGGPVLVRRRVPGRAAPGMST